MIDPFKKWEKNLISRVGWIEDLEESLSQSIYQKRKRSDLDEGQMAGESVSHEPNNIIIKSTKRQRILWAPTETAHLILGVRVYGFKWARILKEYSSKFYFTRNIQSLKDRWRRMDLF